MRRVLGSIPSARRTHGPRTQRCLHTPPGHDRSTVAAHWASPRCHGRVPLPPFHPIGRLPEPMGGSGGRPPLRSEFTSGGALGAAMSVGDMTAPRVASDPASRWVCWRSQSSLGPGGARTPRLRPGGRGDRPCSEGLWGRLGHLPAGARIRCLAQVFPHIFPGPQGYL